MKHLCTVFKLKGAPKELSIPLVLRLFPPSYGTKNTVLEKTVQNVLAKEGFPVALYLYCVHGYDNPRRFVFNHDVFKRKSYVDCPD